MRRFALLLLAIGLMSCGHTGAFSKATGEDHREYAAAAVTLSDFSMKIVAYYQLKNAPIPNDFDKDRFFALLLDIYPDQDRVRSIKNNYRVSVRPLGRGYSVMLCDPGTNRKIMEDFSCHVNRVELRSWESDAATACVFEDNWKPYCEQ